MRELPLRTTLGLPGFPVSPDMAVDALEAGRYFNAPGAPALRGAPRTGRFAGWPPALAGAS